LTSLTKIFIALHVLVSAMLVAGVIVFVNKQEHFQKASETAALEASRHKEALATATSTHSAEIATYKANIGTLTGEIGGLKGQLAAAQQKSNEQIAQLADASTKSALQLAENVKLAEGIKASQDAQTKLNEAVTQLRGNLDTRLTETTQLNAAISDLTNKLDVTERERRFLAEQLTEARATTDRMSGQLKQLGVSTDDVATRAPAGSAPPINGVVRNVDEIAGSTYATISVGSADSVAKGMQFNVIERGTGKFLGTLTVTAVEANEASGRIAGPATASIAPGAEVRTQL
jgi:hypothetical protein